MDAVVTIAPGATYEYFERHLHGAEGGVLVVPKTRVHVGEGARFKTEFELIKGRRGSSTSTTRPTATRTARSR